MFLTKDASSPYYQIVYFVDGKRTKKSTKKSSKAEAEKFMLTFRPEETKEEKRHVITLSNFHKEYSEYILSSKSKSYLSSVNLSFKMLIDFTGDIMLSRLDVRTLDKFVITTFTRTKRGASLYYRTLKAAFTKAISWNYLSVNPFKKIKVPKISKTFPVFISFSELQAILSNTKYDFLRNLFTTAFYTGMRRSELINMKWNWIDFEQNIINVQCSDTFTTKSKKERIIPISPTLMALLANQLPKVIEIDKNNFVFTRIPGIKLTDDFVTKQFKISVRAGGLDDKIHFHTLRHSFASMLVQRGVSLYVVKELLGHEDLSTTQIYSHLQNQNLMDAVNLL